MTVVSSTEEHREVFQSLTKDWTPQWRSLTYGGNDFERLENILHMAYMICKDIDSTDMADRWPDDIRGNVAEAYNAIFAFNRKDKEPYKTFERQRREKNELKQDIDNN